MAACSRDQTTTTEKRDEPATPPQKVMMQLSEFKPSCPLPRFVEIMRSLQGEHILWIVIGVPAGEDEESYELVSSSIMAMWLF